MVHTEPFAAAKHLVHLPPIVAAAMSSEKHFLHVRPRHAEYPEWSAFSFLMKLRRRAVSPDTVIRVAVADDTDPFTDLGMSDEGLWMRGTWDNGAWIGNEARLLELDRKVTEGRILGYSLWTRTWPSSPELAAKAKTRSRAVWPTDSFQKRLERVLLSIMDKYYENFTPDPSRDIERSSRLGAEAQSQYSSYTKSITEQLDCIAGYIFCAAIMVDPSFQRRGVGTHMMRWGLQQAEREGIPIFLIASRKGAHMYEKLGFESLGYMNVEGVLFDQVMIYWPKGVRRIETVNRIDQI